MNPGLNPVITESALAVVTDWKLDRNEADKLVLLSGDDRLAAQAIQGERFTEPENG